MLNEHESTHNENSLRISGYFDSFRVMNIKIDTCEDGWVLRWKFYRFSNWNLFKSIKIVSQNLIKLTFLCLVFVLPQLFRFINGNFCYTKLIIRSIPQNQKYKQFRIENHPNFVSVFFTSCFPYRDCFVHVHSELQFAFLCVEKLIQQNQVTLITWLRYWREPKLHNEGSPSDDLWCTRFVSFFQFMKTTENNLKFKNESTWIEQLAAAAASSRDVTHYRE